MANYMRRQDKTLAITWKPKVFSLICLVVILVKLYKNRLMYNRSSPHKNVSYGSYGNYGNVGNYGNPGNYGSIGTIGGYEDVATPWL